MRFFETLKNIWTIDELRKRLCITLLLILVYRLGCYVVLPGISPSDLDALSNFTNKSGLMQLLDMFSGGAFSQASIFALGIMPYITASIVIQLLGMVLPSFQKMQREGESGRQKLNQYTRFLTVLILVFQGPAYLINLRMQVAAAGGASGMTPWMIAYLTIILAAGSMFIMWLGERITDRGIGNGISFIILVGIIARLPEALGFEFMSRLPGSTGSQGGLIMFVVELILLFAVTVGAVLLVQGTRKVPVQYAKRMVGNRQYGGARQYIPLKVNAAGVMPIIFAQAIMFIPITLAGFSSEGASDFVATFSDINGFWYNFVYFILIVAFTYFYTAVTVRPNDIAENIKNNNGFIPGVKPGKATAAYLDSILSRITLPGSIFLGIVAILPAFARFFGVSQNFAQFFGGTSLLIIVGVVLDTLQQIESHLMMHHYDSLMRDGKIKGRTTGQAY
ncbi:MAG: preprotein translocase subunit SecY [Paramuribaculum sp.]|nr:preprotein translocase subunit SecY [Paramuribaculum sp.]